MRWLGSMLLAGVLGACTSVTLVQRDGCWIRRSERKLGGVNEELGPCLRPPPQWVDDRLTRVVQECTAQADYRWQQGALAAWARGESLPPQPEHEAVVRECMRQGTTAIVAENEVLQRRVEELAAERDALRAGAERDREQLRESSDRLTDYLGEAAKKPPPNAFATASSTSAGTASTDNGSTLQAGGAPAPGPGLPRAVASPPIKPAGDAGAAPAKPAPPREPARKPKPEKPAPPAPTDACARPTDGARLAEGGPASPGCPPRADAPR